jgi:hypothetical protein
MRSAAVQGSTVGIRVRVSLAARMLRSKVQLFNGDGALSQPAVAGTKCAGPTPTAPSNADVLGDKHSFARVLPHRCGKYFPSSCSSSPVVPADH